MNSRPMATILLELSASAGVIELKMIFSEFHDELFVMCCDVPPLSLDFYRFEMTETSNFLKEIWTVIDLNEISCVSRS